MGFALRQPTPADYGAIASWIPDAPACLRWAGSGVPFPFDAAALPRLLAVPDSESYCLTQDGRAPLGFGQLWLRDTDAVRLMRIIVAPQARGRGLGRELCRQLISRAVEVAGAPAVTLAVYRDNLVALALYRSLGFLPVESRSTAELLFMKAVPERLLPAPMEPR